MAANPTTTPVDHVHPTIATDDAPAVSGMWTAMSGRPYPFTSTTGALAKDVWKFVPCRLGAAATFAALTVETTRWLGVLALALLVVLHVVRSIVLLLIAVGLYLYFKPRRDE